jgi:uncharacterized protein (TIGR02246 family)
MMFAFLLPVAIAREVSAQVEARFEDDRKAIAELIERAETANNAGDVEAWVRLFASDAVYMPPGAPPVTTRAGLVEMARAGFRHKASIDIVPEEIEVFGAWAFARSRVNGQVRLAGSGEVIQIDIKQLVIYRRSDDAGWQIARLINNSNTQ